MGEYAEMMLDGTCCQSCGEFLGDGDGFPIFCAGCDPKPRPAPRRTRQRWRDIEPPPPVSKRPFVCDCGKRFKSKKALGDHGRDKHGRAA